MKRIKEMNFKNSRWDDSVQADGLLKYGNKEIIKL